MAYLAGALITGVVWGLCYFLRPDIRKDMVWSSWYFFFIMTVGFIVIKVFAHISPAQSINPGYWSPPTLFNLNNLTGGYGIEDALFMFFIGGIAAVIYEELFRHHITYKRLGHKPHYALLAGVIAALIVASTGINLFYTIVAFSFVGTAVIWIQRRDLILHSILGGISFLIVYVCLYLCILFIYPDFIVQYYNLRNISGILWLGLPLEEYIFAFGLGLMWSPIYEYVKDLR
jgi:hypothetical protein